MKKVAIILLTAVLLAGAIGVLAEGVAEVSNQKGYYVYDGTTPLYSVLRGKEWNVYAVIEYDREHFIRFSDAETNFWGNRFESGRHTSGRIHARAPAS